MIYHKPWVFAMNVPLANSPSLRPLHRWPCPGAHLPSPQQRTDHQAGTVLRVAALSTRRKPPIGAEIGFVFFWGGRGVEEKYHFLNKENHQ